MTPLNALSCLPNHHARKLWIFLFDFRALVCLDHWIVWVTSQGLLSGLLGVVECSTTCLACERTRLLGGLLKSLLVAHSAIIYLRRVFSLVALFWIRFLNRTVLLLGTQTLFTVRSLPQMVLLNINIWIWAQKIIILLGGQILVLGYSSARVLVTPSWPCHTHYPLPLSPLSLFICLRPSNKIIVNIRRWNGETTEKCLLLLREISGVRISSITVRGDCFETVTHSRSSILSSPRVLFCLVDVVVW